MQKIMLIINPTSGGEKALDYKEKLENKAKKYFEQVDTRITQKAHRRQGGTPQRVRHTPWRNPPATSTSQRCGHRRYKSASNCRTTCKIWYSI